MNLREAWKMRISNMKTHVPSLTVFLDLPARPDASHRRQVSPEVGPLFLRCSGASLKRQ